MEAVARKLVRRDFVPQDPGLGALGHEVPDHVAEPLLSPGHLLVPVKERRKLGVVVPMGLVGDESECLEHGFESLARVTCLVSDFGELFQMAGDLAVVPGEQDRFDVREVLVQSRSSDPGLLGDLRHRHGQEPVLGHQRCGGVQDRVTHFSPVRLDRLGPQLRHR